MQKLNLTLTPTTCLTTKQRIISLPWSDLPLSLEDDLDMAPISPIYSV